MRYKYQWLTASIISFATATAAIGAEPAKPEVDPARAKEIAAMLPEQPAGAGKPINDRATWESPAIRKEMADAVGAAEKLLTEPLPPTSDELFLEYSQNGNRTRWQEVNHERRGRIGKFVLAECIENKGRFIPPLVETLESVFQEKTWLYPAHDPSLRNFKGETVTIDLGSVAVAWSMATADWLLGDKLPKETRKLIREQIQKRIFASFMDMMDGKRKADWWLTGRNNWNAVCLAGVTGAALAIVEPREERAYYVAAAEKYSKHFLGGIPADGYCTEGVGYWNYGFGNYVMLAESVLQATGGKVDLLKNQHVRRIAMYGLSVPITPSVCPAFADCSVNARPSPTLVDYIARRWDLPVPPLKEIAVSWSAAPLYWTMTFAFPNSVSDKPTPRQEPLAERTWFEKGGVLIGRPGTREKCRLSVAIKGGHNAEEHNHNDVGSYMVVVDDQAVLVDPGAEVYTKRTFSEHRYDSKVLNSFGHPVPMVAGKMQRSGRDARGQVLRTEFSDTVDTLVLDIRSAYDVPALEKLERTFTYSRMGEGSLTVTDEVVFTQPQSFGTALVTFGKVAKTGSGQLLIEDGAAALTIDVKWTGNAVVFQADEIHEDLIAKRTPTRIGINLDEPVKKARITVAIMPTRPELKERAVERLGR